MTVHVGALRASDFVPTSDTASDSLTLLPSCHFFLQSGGRVCPTKAMCREDFPYPLSMSYLYSLGYTLIDKDVAVFVFLFFSLRGRVFFLKETYVGACKCFFPLVGCTLPVKKIWSKKQRQKK